MTQRPLTDEEKGFYVVAAGDVGDGRECLVYWRMFNAIITIGPKGSRFYDTHW